MRSKDLTKLTGVASRTLDFWVRSKLLEPSVTPANGTGSKREYSIADVVQCRVAVLLRSMGIETSRIAPILKRVRRGAAFLIVDPSGDITSIPNTANLSTFQPNTTVMLFINVAAIRASYVLAASPKPAGFTDSPTAPVEHDPTPKDSTPGGHI